MSCVADSPSTARVAKSSAVVGAVAAAYAALRGSQAPTRAGVATAALSAPFFALREVFLSSSTNRDASISAPVASSLAGGLVGYIAALMSGTGTTYGAAKTAVTFGASCGVFDAFIAHLDWRRRVYLVNRQLDMDQPSVVESTNSSVNSSTSTANYPATGPQAQVIRIQNLSELNKSVTDLPKPPSESLPWYFKWPSWFPVLKEVDFEYEELLRRREDIILALEAEQERITALLEALEDIKARKNAHALKSQSSVPTSSTTQTISLKSCSVPCAASSATGKHTAIGQHTSVQLSSSSSTMEHIDCGGNTSRILSSTSRPDTAPARSQTMSDVTDPASPPGSPPTSP